MQKRLYVLISNKLDSIYGCVQGGHAVAQWLLNHPSQDWNNNYLIYVSADLSKWKERLDILNIDYTEFREPDLDYQITALAVLNNDKSFILPNCPYSSAVRTAVLKIVCRGFESYYGHLSKPK